ncbi:MAG: cadherin domain-containing protein, partial [Planctomycetota bacterium]
MSLPAWLNSFVPAPGPRAGRPRRSRRPRKVPETAVPLEARVMLSGYTTAFDAATGVLTITGTGGVDTLTVLDHGGNIAVDDGAAVTSTGVATASITGLAVSALGGNDVVTVDDSLGSMIAMIYGGSGDDVLRGGLGHYVIFGEDGDDELHGGDGNDILIGGDGTDTLIGGAGADTLHGGLGDDRIEGLEGDDEIHGGNGRDSLFGGTGDDVIHGGDEADNTPGGGDYIEGNDGVDTLYGNAGGDIIVGGAGADTLHGGLGDDDVGGEGPRVVAGQRFFAPVDWDTYAPGATAVGHVFGRVTTDGPAPLTFSITGGNPVVDGHNLFAIDAATGALSLTTSDVSGDLLGHNLVLQLTVTDGTSSDSADVVVTPTPTTRWRTYEAEDDYISNDFTTGIGRATHDGWGATVADHAGGWMLFGPGTHDVTGGLQTVRLRAKVTGDPLSLAPTSQVMWVDVIDQTAAAQGLPADGSVVAWRGLTRSDFATLGEYEEFDLTFEAVEGHTYEFRVGTNDTADVVVDHVRVTQTGAIADTYRATDPAIGHIVGSQDGDYWRAVAGVDAPGYLSYGPYQTYAEPTHVEAEFRLWAEGLTPADDPNAVLATVDIHAAGVPHGEILASRNIYRWQFPTDAHAVSFVLDAEVEAGRQVEYRVFWSGAKTLKQDRISITRNVAPVVAPGQTFSMPVNRPAKWFGGQTLGPTFGSVFGYDRDGDDLSYAIVGGNPVVDGRPLFAIDAETGDLRSDALDLIDLGATYTLTVEVGDGRATSTGTVTVSPVPYTEWQTAEAEASPAHGTGSPLADGSGRAADPATDTAGLLSSQNFYDAAPGLQTARFRLRLDGPPAADGDRFGRLEIIDAATGAKAAAQTLIGRDFASPGQWEDFDLTFRAEAGTLYRALVTWEAASGTTPALGLAHDWTKVTTTGPVHDVYRPTEAVFGHLAGSLSESDGSWSTDPRVHGTTPTYMTYGPYVAYDTGDARDVNFRLRMMLGGVDPQTPGYDDIDVAVIDIHATDPTKQPGDPGHHTLLSSRSLKVGDFTVPGVYEEFSLSTADAAAFDLTGKLLEFRVYWQGEIGLKQDWLTVEHARPVEVAAGQSFTIAEDAAVGTTVGHVAATNWLGYEVDFAITAGDASGQFTIDDQTGRITTAAALDYETAPLIDPNDPLRGRGYVLTVLGTDEVDPVDVAAEVVVEVTDVADGPTFGTPGYQFGIDENRPAGTVVGTTEAAGATGYAIVAGNDAGLFAIDSAGVITTTAGLDYETAGSYALTVEATDGTSAVTAAVIVDVTDVADAGTVGGITWQLVGDQLFIDGTDTDDAITVGQTAAGYIELVTHGGTTSTDVLASTSHLAVVVIRGHAGNDLIVVSDSVGSHVRSDIDGGVGDDELVGGVGDDLILGGEGEDDIFGGSGLDKFVFQAGWGGDRVHDFEAGETIEFSGFGPSRDLTGDGVFDEADVLASAIDLGTTKVVFDLGLGDLLTVTKTGGATTADVLAAVGLIPPEPISFAGGPFAFSISEDAAWDGSVAFGVVPISGGLPAEVSYAITNGTSPFSIGVDGTLTLVAPLDYEADASYSLEVTATDGFSSATTMVDVAVTDVDEVPVELIDRAGEVARWTFDLGTAAGGAVADHAVSGVSDDVGTLTGDAFVVGGDVRLDGAGDYVDFVDSDDLTQGPLSDRTYAFWFEADDVTSNDRQVLLDLGDDKRGISIYLQAGRLYASHWDGPSDVDDVSPTWISSAGTLGAGRHHVALTFGGGTSVADPSQAPDAEAVVGLPTLQLFLDGLAVGTKELVPYTYDLDDFDILDFEEDVPLYTPEEGYAGLRLGAIHDASVFHDGLSNADGGDGFAGVLDDVRVFSRKLTADEIATISAEGVFGFRTASETVELFVPSTAGTTVTQVRALAAPDDGVAQYQLLGASEVVGLFSIDADGVITLAEDWGEDAVAVT